MKRRKKIPKKNLKKIPLHVAVIMDGNGRWAKKRGLPRVKGHQEGVKSIKAVARACTEYDIKYLTLYAFSTENWDRPKDEVNFLMNLLTKYLDEIREELRKQNARFNVIGDISKLPREARDKIRRNMDESRTNTGLTFTLALSYSGRSEIVRAVKKIGEEVDSGRIRPEEINENVISSHLYTHDMPDPDLLIRTSGEFRVSNFLLWQISYAEIYVTPTLWPDFREDGFLKALSEFEKRERRFGLTERVS